MSKAYKIPLKKKVNIILDHFWGFWGPETMSPKLRGAQVKLLQNSAGHRLRGPKLRGANLPSIFSPQSFGPLNICPVDFWTLQPVPRGDLEQCNLCPAEYWRHSFRDQYNH